MRYYRRNKRRNPLIDAGDFDTLDISVVPPHEAIERIKGWLVAHDLDDPDIDIYVGESESDVIVISGEGSTLQSLFFIGPETTYADMVYTTFNDFVNRFLGYEISTTSWSLDLYPIL